MKRLQRFCICAGIVLLLGACSTIPPKQEEAKKVVMAYFYGGAVSDDMPMNLLTHVCYAFANVYEDGSVHLESGNDSANLEKLVALKVKNPQLMVLLSIGGWGWSKYFSNAALTAESRQIFIESAVDIMTRHNLDGLDIDWEYPGLPGNGNVFRPEDKRNFTLLLKGLRKQLDAIHDGRRRQLTVATGAFPFYLQKTEPKNFERYLDYVNVMTYDFRGFGAPFTGHHTNLRYSSTDTHGNRSAMNAVEEHIASGIPASKLVLGCAFYGKGWEGGVDSTGNGLFARVNNELSKEIGASYAQLVDGYIDKNGFVRFWDEDSLAPYLWNPATQAFITYDDTESVTAKCRYVNLRGLAGAMFWEYHGDKDNRLLNAIYQTLTSGESDVPALPAEAQTKDRRLEHVARRSYIP